MPCVGHINDEIAGANEVMHVAFTASSSFISVYIYAPVARMHCFLWFLHQRSQQNSNNYYLNWSGPNAAAENRPISYCTMLNFTVTGICRYPCWSWLTDVLCWVYGYTWLSCMRSHNGICCMKWFLLCGPYCRTPVHNNDTRNSHWHLGKHHRRSRWSVEKTRNKGNYFEPNQLVPFRATQSHN